MSQTLKNLATAFLGESQARNRYTIFASTARKEGYEQIAGTFLLTAEQEKEHAEWLYKMMQEIKGDEQISLDNIGVEIPFGTTLENLKAAMHGENYEHTTMYPAFADKAQEEGYTEIAGRLRAIAKAELHHEDRYKAFAEEIEKNQVFAKEEQTVWTCRHCGYMHTATTAPTKCPSCGHAQAYFEVRCCQKM